MLATDVGGNSELVDHCENGFLFQAGDIKLLASWIVEATKGRKLLPLMGENARKKICKLHSFDKMVSAYRNLYHGIYSKDKSKR